ncbi:hypothetical protein F4680DRAFT_312954 [Xylaria scruposa]|nr:hypothetical protein F4680DRAFT_312954 [Xylaria scruposa]
MKPVFILILFPIFCCAWQKVIWQWKEQAQDFLSNPWRQSRVPQFILDARHPWIVENQKKLEQLPDVESYLCLSSQVSTADSDIVPKVVENGLQIPPDLFDYLEIDNNRCSRPGWPNALMRAQEINGCPAALSQVKQFKTSIFVHDSKYSDTAMKMLEPSRPSPELVDLFADVLGNMTSLDSLTWSIPPAYIKFFEKRFIDRGLVLPSVKTLEIDRGHHFLVPMCSNITNLEYGGKYPWQYNSSPNEDPESLLLRSTMSAPNITRLGMVAGWRWDHSQVQEVVSYLPGLESFGMRGELKSRYRYSSFNHDFDYSDGSTLGEILQILGSLQNLTQLDLPPAWDLDVGFDGGPGCGNAYFGPGGRNYQRDVYRQSLEAIERAAAIVVKVLPSLTGFSIGNTPANITRYGNGTARASFPWTGRIFDYVMEEMPGGPDGPDW